MSEVSPQQFDNVRITCKANVYYDGRVVSHSLDFPDGTKRSIGLLYPGSYTFGTEAAELMEIIAGSCQVTLPGEDSPSTYEAGSHFNVAANSSFDITIESGLTEYVCTYL